MRTGKDRSTRPHVAIVHEWLTGMRGGEKCVEALCEVFPEATLFTLLHVKDSASPTIERMPIRTSFIQHLPFAEKRYRHYLPLFPKAIDGFDVSDFDIVISSNHAVAKGVRTNPGTLHVCYCHTPMRYIWNLYDEYFGKERAGPLTRLGMKMFVNYLRGWDLRTAKNPQYFIANSRNVQARINEIYHRESVVIYPPVDTTLFRTSKTSGDYHLIVSAFVPYKRIDLAIEAFNRTGEKLAIIGDGPDDARLRAMAKANIEFLGWQPDDVLKRRYAECRALIFPGEEDFGIVPLEAMASGKPVIAYAKGGALETVIERDDLKTGVLFHEHNVDSIIEAIEKSRLMKFDVEALRAHALQFDKEVYKRKMKEFVDRMWERFLQQ